MNIARELTICSITNHPLPNDIQEIYDFISDYFHQLDVHENDGEINFKTWIVYKNEYLTRTLYTYNNENETLYLETEFLIKRKEYFNIKITKEELYTLIKLVFLKEFNLKINNILLWI